MKMSYTSFLSSTKLYETIALIKNKEITTCTTLYRDTAEGKDSEKIRDFMKIFQHPSDNSSPKRILIEGAPGIGKTVLCKEIAYRWAKNELLTSCGLLLLLFLRDVNVQKISSVQELAEYFASSNHEAHILCSYLENKGIATIILDGFDEMDSKLHKCSFFIELIKKRHLPRATILVTSRPFASACLHHAADQRVKIIGLHQSSKKQCAAEALKNFPSRFENLQKYLKQNPNIDALCYIPSMMSIIIHICLNQPEDLPPTIAKVYKKFIMLTICEYLKGKNKVPKDTVINKMEQFPQSVIQKLQQITKFAFNSLVADKTVFSAEEILDDNLGLLKSVEHCGSRNSKLSFNFLHLTIQEFLAAVYITSLSAHEIPEKLKEIYDNSSWFSEVWTLYCNLAGENGLRQNLRLITHAHPLPIHDHGLELNKFQASAAFQLENTTFDPGTTPPVLKNSILQLNGCHNPRLLPLSTDVWRLILDTSTTSSVQYKPAFKTQIGLCSEENLLQKVIDDPIKILYLSKCSLEAQVDTLDEVLSEPFSCNIVSFKNYKLSVQDIEYLGLFLTSKAKWTEINLCNCQIGDEGIIVLHRYLCRETDEQQEISTMDFMNNNLSAVSLSFISDIISCCHIHTVKLGCNNFASVWGITTVLKNTTALKVLNLWCCGITVQEATAISEKIKTNTLEKLNIGANNLSDDGAKSLSHLISETTTLQVLNIIDNNIGPQGTVAIAQALLLNTSLLKLNLTNNELGQEGAVAMADAITSNETLEELLLYGDKTLGEESAIMLLEKLYNSNNTTIIKLGLSKKFTHNNCINSHIENINMKRRRYNKKDVKFRFH